MSISPRLASNPSNSRAERLSGIHILIVISSERAGDLVKRIFIALGFTNIYIAADAIEAVQYLRDIKLHLIVADADINVGNSVNKKTKHLAGFETLQLSGIEFIHRLRSSKSSPAPFIPVLMLMDHARDLQVIQARDAGVNEIVLKPLEAKNFCERIIALVDSPRPYITAQNYHGPCRRLAKGASPTGVERRKRDVRLIRCNEAKGAIA
jgi:two-component system, chemotaxis family, chemotaxis protein CheY